MQLQYFVSAVSFMINEKISYVSAENMDSKSNIWFQLFEKLQSQNLDLEDRDLSFDEGKIKDYLDKINNNEHKEIINALIKNTVYVKFSTFKQELLNAFNQFTHQIGNNPFYIMLPEKISSSHWFVALLWNRIKQLNLQGFLNIQSKITTPINILIIDDCIYSGTEIAGMIDEFTTNNVYNDYNFHIVAPYYSEAGKASIESMKKSEIEKMVENLPEKFKPKFINGVSNDIKYYTIHKVPTLVDITKNLDIDTYTVFGFQSNILPLIIFDHKVANSSSTYRSFYLDGKYCDSSCGLMLKNNYSREKIDQIENLSYMSILFSK
ncbi:MAG: hypothetical protein QW478_01010 [Candidatus Micrarchaeaceae archaeon]